MSVKIVGICFAAMTMAGCAHVEATKASNADLEMRIATSIPVCRNEEDCRIKWEAAQLFVQKNAGMKLQTVTNVVIETFNSPQYSTSIAMSVTKELIGNGIYRIVASASCSNIFGCQPKVSTVLLDFNSAVSAAN